MTEATHTSEHPMCTAILDLLDQHKAEEISCLDVRNLTDITDVMVVCNATSPRHAKTLAEYLSGLYKEQHGVKAITEGEDHGEWVLIDMDDVIVHIMLAEIRDFYQLEKLWDPALSEQD